jgi:plastocyanin
VKRFLSVATMACLAFTAAPGAVASAVDPAARARVKIVDFAFKPHLRTVAVGTKVIWINRGASTHTSTSDDGRWDSPPLAPGQRFKFVFNSPGSYTYHCSIHPAMTGEVDVTP